MKKHNSNILVIVVAILLTMLLIGANNLFGAHPNIFLYDKDFNEINPITGDNADQPFSVKVTCGLCHDYEVITSGYHFQHGWDEISDTFGIARGKPWLLSDGMMGGWSPPSYRLLSKKHVSHADEIDLTSYDFVGFSEVADQPPCGACHAGGGGMEYDREGNRYDEYLAENPELVDSLDGDYYKSNWHKSGVVEADCFICHMEGYNMPGRVEQLENGNYQWAVVAGSRIGIVDGAVKYGDEPTVSYNTRLFNSDGSITLEMSWPPPDDNCMFCHGSKDMRKRGFSWNDIFNPDIHNQQGISCAACHPSGLDHQFARGEADLAGAEGHVAHSMTDCYECHNEGFLGALIPTHMSVRSSHLKRITCEACHIPELGRAAVRGFDVSTGELVNYTRPPEAEEIGDRIKWLPNYHRLEDKNIYPINDMLGVMWGNVDSDGHIYILYLNELEKAWDIYSEEVSDDNDDGEAEVNTEAEIIAGLNAFKQSLADNQRFSKIEPVYLKGNQVYSLDTAGKLITGKYEFQSNFMYHINHNVAPARLALGYGGCDDCHAEDAHFFKGKMMTDMFTPDGDAAMASIGRGLGCNPIIFHVNTFHQQILSPLVSFLIIFVVFMVTLHYHRYGPKRIPFIYGSGEVKRFNFLERGVHLFRLITFIILTISGLIMAFNWSGWQNLLFASPDQMMTIHIVCGFIFIVTTIMGIVIWFKDALYASYDKVWVKMIGGYLGHKGEVPSGRFNAGQKTFYWFTAIFGIIISVSGLILTFKPAFQLSTICLFSTIHNLVAFILIAGVFAHAYLGTIANPGTWRVLIDGYVTRTWAKHHHPNWYQMILEKRREEGKGEPRGHLDEIKEKKDSDKKEEKPQKDEGEGKNEK